MRAEAWFGPWGPKPPAQETSTRTVQPRTALPLLQGRPRHLEAHVARLQAGATHLGKPSSWLPAILPDLTAWLQTWGHLPSAALRLRLWVEDPRLHALLEPLPVVTLPYRLVVLPHPLGARKRDPALAHKGLGGPWSQAVLDAVRTLGADDALLCWPDGTLAETAIASLAVQQGDRLLLPPPEGRVASLAERLDLPDWAAAQGLQLAQAPISLEMARQGQVWCLNALRGVWPALLS